MEWEGGMGVVFAGGERIGLYVWKLELDNNEVMKGGIGI